MIKQKPRNRLHVRKGVSNSTGSKQPLGLRGDSIQNMKPSIGGKSLPFNTKGYYSSSEPYDQEYLKVKQEVYKKYRSPNQELVVIDSKLTKPSVYIHRGLLKTNNDYLNENALNKQKLINNFIKNYMNRKQKRQQIDSQKYYGSQSAKRRQSLPTLSQNLDSLQGRSNIRTALRISISRAPSSRSNFSNKQN